jgi:hypothetical protein
MGCTHWSHVLEPVKRPRIKRWLCHGCWRELKKPIAGICICKCGCMELALNEKKTCDDCSQSRCRWRKKKIVKAVAKVEKV